MAEMIRVRIGSDDPKYFPADQAKQRKQALFVDVVENPRKFDNDTKEWVDGEPRWYHAKFQGRDADLIQEQYQKGDALVVFGEKVLRETHKNDKVYRSTDLRVNGFGPDPRDAAVTLDRSRRPGRSQTQSQSQEQWAASEASQDVDAEADQRLARAEAVAAHQAAASAAPTMPQAAPAPAPAM